MDPGVCSLLKGQVEAERNQAPRFTQDEVPRAVLKGKKENHKIIVPVIHQLPVLAGGDLNDV